MGTRSKTRKTLFKKTGSESSMRRHLAHKGRIKSQEDDRGFYAVLVGLSAPHDCRTPNEKEWQDRIAGELGIRS